MELGGRRVCHHKARRYRLLLGFFVQLICFYALLTPDWLLSPMAAVSHSIPGLALVILWLA